jgi:hypothetical protein
MYWPEVAMKTLLFLSILTVSLHSLWQPARVLAQHNEPTVIAHVVVFDEAGRYGGWPSNNGAWSWGDEVVVGFDDGHFFVSDRNRAGRGHSIDYDRPVTAALGRSLDGGSTWTIEHPPGLQPPPGILIAGLPTAEDGLPVRSLQDPMPFDHPDFALSLRMSSATAGDSRFYYSIDRGRSWDGPFEFPNLGFMGIQARTDYLIEGPRRLLAMLSAATDSGEVVIAARTRDGGLTWEYVSTVGPGNEPSTVRISKSVLVTVVRNTQVRDGLRVGTVEGYRSEDGGESWIQTGVIAEPMGNAPDLTLLPDGRLVCTYGFRVEPYGIRARVSSDGGRSWGPEVQLRDDGGTYDLGYPLTVQRDDGLLVTAYYFNHGLEDERFIAATIWDPGR